MTATALGLPAVCLADTTLLRMAERVRSLRLTLAVLRDIFADDGELTDWLETEREALDGLAPVTAIMAGRENEVVELAIVAWNESACLTVQPVG